MSRARAVWFERPGVAAVRDEALGAPGPGEVVVRGTFSGVSAGTERLVLLGKVPESARAAMTLPAMRGSFAFPLAYGYALVGDVLGGDGAPVFALAPHADRAVVRADALRPLPRGVPGPRLTLAPNLETAVNVVWDAEVALGDRVVVLGLGVVGLLVASLAKRAGARVLGVDPDEDRRALAAALGVDATGEASRAELGAADAIVDASGAPAALARAFDEAGLDARVVVASWYGDAAPALPLGGGFHPNRVRVVSSQVAHLPPHRRARWDAARRWSLVSELLADAALDTMVAPPIPLSDAPSLYAALASGARWSPPHRVFDLRP